jgi:hypothetical protein
MSQAQAVKSFGDLPLIVLTRGLDQDPDWQAGQAALLQLSTNSQQLFAEKSGHNIELDQPDAAVEAIVKMVQIIHKPQEGSLLLFYGMERAIRSNANVSTGYLEREAGFDLISTLFRPPE